MASASWWSRLLFYWPYPLLKLGLERPLEDADLPEILTPDSSRYNREYFERLWAAELERNPDKPSLHRAMLADFFRSIWFVHPAMALAASAQIVQAVALGNLIDSFETGDGQGYFWAAILVVCGLVIVLEHHHVFFCTWRKGMQLRVSCVASIYSKTLKLSSTHQESSASTGKIMNLASNDVERFVMAALFINHLIWSPLQSIAILIVGWDQMGPSFAAGFALLVFGFVPFQFYLSNRFAYFRSRIAAITDRRVNFVSQAVQGARVMKMSGYEQRFLDRILDLRRREVTEITRASRLKAWNEAIFYSANVVISLVIFLVHVAMGGVLAPGSVFTVFTLINILQLQVTKHMSLGVMGVSEVYVSITRIQNFLQFSELPKPNEAAAGHPVSATKNDEERGGTARDTPSTPIDEGDVIFAMKHVDCYWNHVQGVAASDTTEKITDSNVDILIPADKQDQETDSDTSSPSLMPSLSDVTLDLRRGELTCVIGPVGCGKSALLQAIVGELPVYKGSLEWKSQHEERRGAPIDDVQTQENTASTRLCLPTFAYAAQGEFSCLSSLGAGQVVWRRCRVGIKLTLGFILFPIITHRLRL
jgi:ABC-type multidrug transport system fused ATPase/permease subunit